ncbi:hypothetical protein N5E89_00885 [Comamonas aquatica]|uniref:hypothetical protein n=1 Tax=Comamonas aquatica TaxID=225991 RepID=UPI00244B6C3A|nr:hypothetical protein [Comamonas aquatica]MDH1426933.1 hypothetical protein [Comamonas aquatica]
MPQAYRLLSNDLCNNANLQVTGYRCFGLLFDKSNPLNVVVAQEDIHWQLPC